MSDKRRTAIFTYKGHESLTYPEGHPFRPERAAMLMEILEREGILGVPWLEMVPAIPATSAEMRRFHAAEYIDALERAGRGEVWLEMLGYGIGSEDCPAFIGVFELARLAAGSSLVGARMLADGAKDLAFNPIGGFHHAGPAYAEGFCYVNDVVLACMELADRGLRVACVDLDVHHGNGTEAAFISDPRVLTVSTHESGKTLYPWGGSEMVTGEGPGRGYNVNVPLPAGIDDGLFQRAFNAVVMPVVRKFAPDVVVLETGMDVLSTDPLGHLRMTNNSIADAIAQIRDLGRPILALGGGGYDPRNTARGWALALMVLCDAETEDQYEGLVGGVFLGDEDRQGGLRDMSIYVTGPEREALKAEVDRVIEFHLRNTFPIHSIS